jgi:hypothetical protein
MTTPFYRGIKEGGHRQLSTPKEVYLTDKVRAELPCIKRMAVSQEKFSRELDVYSHDVLFDDNIPAITVKTNEGGYLEIKQYRVGVPFQVIIRNKQVRHLCVNPIIFTLANSDPSDKQMENFVRIKDAWVSKNMEGIKTKFVENQKSYGNAGLLFYMDDGKVNARNISFEDGYKIITHKNNNGKHILECLYYVVNDVEYIDCYDDTYFTRLTNEITVDQRGAVTSSWKRYPSVAHGFSENPLITHRGDVAWNEAQSDIEAYESLYNTFLVIQKRHGWGIIYIKGQLQNNGQKIAGNVVLVDNSGNPESDAKILDAPSPQNMIDTLKEMKRTIEMSAGTTIILPEDINISSDISGLAVELTQEIDMATAQHGVIEWQNVASKMQRLFSEGLARELVYSGENPTAITEFDDLRINAKFQVWKPKSEEAHNVMVEAAYGAGIISEQTAVEKNTLSNPDELMRIKKEKKEKEDEEARKLAEQSNEAAATSQTSTTSSVEK